MTLTMLFIVLMSKKLNDNEANYEWYLNRKKKEKKVQAEIMKKKFAELHEMLAKAHWGNE